jgi:hypothetical protein
MTLSRAARRRMQQSMGNQANAKEICDAIDESVNYIEVEEILTLTLAVSRAMTAQIPVGAVIRSIHVNNETLVAGDGTGDNALERIGVGIAGNVAKYGATANLLKNTKLSRNVPHAVLAAAETITLFGVATNGTTAATERFVAGGRVRIRVCYVVPLDLPNAP